MASGAGAHAQPLSQFVKRLPRGAAVIDVGCGDFRRIHRNVARRRSDISVVGLERFPEGAPGGPGPIYPPCLSGRFTRLTCDVERDRFPFPDAAFDGAVFSHVIEHVGDAGSVLREIHRTLKSGGLLYVETPGPISMSLVRPSWLPRTPGDTINFFDDPTHVGTAYSADRLRQTLDESGFEVVAQGPFRQLGTLGAPIYLLLMAVGALPVLPAGARTFAYGAGLRNLVGWAISALARKR